MMLFIGHKLKIKSTNNQLSGLHVPFCERRGSSWREGLIAQATKETRTRSGSYEKKSKGLWQPCVSYPWTPRLPIPPSRGSLPPKPSHLKA